LKKEPTLDQMKLYTEQSSSIYWDPTVKTFMIRCFYYKSFHFSTKGAVTLIALDEKYSTYLRRYIEKMAKESNEPLFTNRDGNEIPTSAAGKRIRNKLGIGVNCLRRSHATGKEQVGFKLTEKGEFAKGMLHSLPVSTQNYVKNKEIEAALNRKQLFQDYKYRMEHFEQLTPEERRKAVVSKFRELKSKQKNDRIFQCQKLECTSTISIS
jgi:hypothetical protein